MIEKARIHKLPLHFKELENQQQIKTNPGKGRERIKIKAEINEIETRDTVEHINGIRSWFFERIKKIDKPQAKLFQKKRECSQVNKIMNERGEIMTKTKEIETIRNYDQQLYANKLSNLEEMENYSELEKDGVCVLWIMDGSRGHTLK